MMLELGFGPSGALTTIGARKAQKSRRGAPIRQDWAPLHKSNQAAVTLGNGVRDVPCPRRFGKGLRSLSVPPVTSAPAAQEQGLERMGAILSFPIRKIRRIRQAGDVLSKLEGLRNDLISAAGETRDPLASEDLMSAASRLRQVLRQIETESAEVAQ